MNKQRQTKANVLQNGGKRKKTFTFPARTEPIEERKVARIAVMVIRGAAILLLLVGFAQGFRLAYKAIYSDNPKLMLTDIEVRDAAEIPEHVIREASGLIIGRHCYSFDLKKVRENLLKLPKLEDVKIELRVLGTRNIAEIKVVERSAVAWFVHRFEQANDPASAWLLDANGIAFKASGTDATDPTLPVIAGMSPAELQQGKPAPQMEVHAALRILALNKVAGHFRPTRFDLSKSCRVVVTDTAGCQYTFPADAEKVAAAWQRYEYILKVMSEQPTEERPVLVAANMVPERNLPVKLVYQGTAETQPRPKLEDEQPPDSQPQTVRSDSPGNGPVSGNPKNQVVTPGANSSSKKPQTGSSNNRVAPESGRTSRQPARATTEPPRAPRKSFAL
jgi:cell division septal protein FtsQ